VATSLLAAAGLADLAAPERESFIEKAVELANSPGRAQSMRETSALAMDNLTGFPSVAPSRGLWQEAKGPPLPNGW
jgi:predicted O-linked N-acetylglucosamine transferase (SPINDLY family)